MNRGKECRRPGEGTYAFFFFNGPVRARLQADRGDWKVVSLDVPSDILPASRYFKQAYFSGDSTSWCQVMAQPKEGKTLHLC